MIYLDNAATTKMRSECVEELNKFYAERFFNPSAPYKPALDAEKMIKEAKADLLKYLRAPEGNIVFTSSGTEADNLAIFGTLKTKRNKIVITSSEHAAVFATAQELSLRGFDVLVAPVTASGHVILSELCDLLDSDVTFVSVMHVNNETGAINDLEAIGKIVREKSPKAIFHSDGVQAFGKIQVNLRAAGVDLYSVSAHKLHGPKGVGALYVRKGINLKPHIFGGGQEAGLRSSTENTGGIAAFKKAADIQMHGFDRHIKRMRELKDMYVSRLVETFGDDVIINTSKDNSSPSILSVAFKDVRGEVLLHALEKHKIYVGIGSACSSKKSSRIKDLFLLPQDYIDGIIRLSFSGFNGESEVPYVIEKMKKEYDTLRKIKRN